MVKSICPKLNDAFVWHKMKLHITVPYNYTKKLNQLKEAQYSTYKTKVVDTDVLLVRGPGPLERWDLELNCVLVARPFMAMK